MKEWIARQPRFAEGYKIDPSLHCLRDKAAGFPCRSFYVKVDRRRLDDSQCEFWKAGHGSSSLSGYKSVKKARTWGMIASTVTPAPP